MQVRSCWRVTLATGALVALSIATAAAQGGAVISDTVEDRAAVQDPDEKGGLFGKVKKLARNKTVQAAARTAACTMVPGGNVIVAAAEARDAGDPARAAAATAQPCAVVPPESTSPAAAVLTPGAAGYAPAAVPPWTSGPDTGPQQAQIAALRQAIADGRAHGLDAATLRQMEEALRQLEAAR